MSSTVHWLTGTERQNSSLQWNSSALNTVTHPAMNPTCCRVNVRSLCPTDDDPHPPPSLTAGPSSSLLIVRNDKGPGLLSDSVVRSDQLLRETSGADQGNHYFARLISSVRSTDFQYWLIGSHDLVRKWTRDLNSASGRLMVATRFSFCFCLNRLTRQVE